MKTKSIAMVLIILMSICLTACEDERNVAVYGTGLEENVGTSVRHNLSPTAPVETEPVAPVEAYIYNAFTGYSDEIGEYVAVTVVITNNTGETQEAGHLAEVNVISDSGSELIFCTNNPPAVDDEGIRKKIDNGKQMVSIVTFANPLSNYSLDGIEYIDITLKTWYMSDTGTVLDTRRFYLTEE